MPEYSLVSIAKSGTLMRRFANSGTMLRRRMIER